MPRFFCPFPLAVGAEIPLPEAVAHHVQVLRLGRDAQIVLFNGEGGEYVASLTSIEKKRVLAEVKTFSPREAELPYSLTLAQALPEGTKMDWIIEKAVELGVSSVVPIAAQRSVVRLSAERAIKKIEHWQGVIAAAAEQSGRNRIPHLSEPMSLNDWLAQQNLHFRILFSPRAEQPLSDWARHHPPQALSLLVGPEGGFSEQEEDAALAHGVIALSLGPRVLRTETAGLAAIAALNALWGEL
jgi:16S rRNA (uracil1498-N3)-methyltransferase